MCYFSFLQKSKIVVVAILLSLQLQKKSFEFKNFEDLKSENFNISLKSTNDKPAKITEFRQGKPYRSIVVENAEYSEVKEGKQVVKENFTTEINTLKNKVVTQKEQIKELKTKVEKLEFDNMQLSKNFKYLLYVLILLSVIWICERSGLFRLVKRFFNS